jgi:Concanavalin A-like lectin/glucanases superfamily
VRIWSWLRWGRRRLVIVASCCVVILAGAAVWAGPASARDVPRAFSGLVTPAGSDSTAAASASARRTGRRVEVQSARSALATVYANPDGSFTRVQSASPVRVRRGTAWVPVDPALHRRSDGSLTTNATTLSLRLSGGGTGSLAVLAGPGWSIALGWPDQLPAPVTSGATATYRGVLPGVDLSVTGTDHGFSEQLTVNSRSAAANPALRAIHFTLTSRGVSVHRAPDGTLTGIDDRGTSVFTALPPVMWDADGAADGNRAPRHTAVALDLSPVPSAGGSSFRHGVLTLRPDRSFLTAPTTSYPVVIDPSFAGTRLAWLTVDAAYPTVSYFNGANLPADPQGQAMVGYNTAGWDLSRSFFRMNTAPIAGKHILSATFQILEKWSWSCTAAPVQLWWTGAIDAGQTWNNQPSWNTKIAEVSAAHGNETYGCGDGNVEFNATSIVASAAAGKWANVTLGLRAGDESTSNGWKRFDPNPSLAITYNSVPNAPTNLSIDGHPCSSGTYVGTLTPTMRATVTDPDSGTQLSVGLYWAATGSAVSQSDKVTQTNVPTGSQAVKPVPAGKLVDGGSYYFQATSSDGIDTSAASAQCAFHVDSSRPDHPPTVASNEYPPYPGDGNTHGGVGRTGTFTFGSGGVSDVVSYLYGWQDPPTTPVAAAGGSATVTLTPPPPSLIKHLFVRSLDRAGNPSNITDYVFLLGSATDPAGSWNADDGGGTTLADSSGGGHPATLHGTASWTAGRTQGADGAAHFNGADGYAETAAPVVHTDQSFSVAAWVRLSSITAGRFANAVSQNGVADSAFSLSFNGGAWEFDLHSVDSNAPTIYTTKATAPVQAGVWTHLAAVYDAGSHQMMLYVNGVLAGTTNGVTAFDAASSLDLGRARWNSGWTDWWPGDVDAVRVWDRVVYGDEIASIANTETLMGDWELDGDGSDASGRAHPVTAPTGPTWTAGHDGSGGLTFDGATQYAETAGPVLPTDQSFTVAAWVRLARTNLGRWATAVSQNGSAFSSFVLSTNGTSWAFAVHSADVNSPTLYRAVASGTAPAGEWTHLAGVYDAGVHQMLLYVNGQQVASLADVHPYNSTGTLDLGRARVSSSWGDWWPGDVDAVHVYLGALSDAQIADLANS